MTSPVPPHRPVAELTAEAAALIAAAEHSAQLDGHRGLSQAAEAVDSVRALALLAARLPELIDQLGAFLSSEQAAGRLAPAGRSGSDLELARVARDARDRLLDARRVAAVLADELAAAGATLAAVDTPWAAHPIPE